jgi:Mg2+/Co2+ transporter CorB
LSDHWRSVIVTFIAVLVVSFLLNAGADSLIASAGLVPSLLGLIVIILIGVVFDMVGTAVAAAEEAPLHAMAGDKVPGAKQAIWLTRNADSVASLCNDVIGDICGTLAGAAAATIAYRLSTTSYFLRVFMAAMAAALTIGLKRAEKSFALGKATDIIYFVGKMIFYFEKATGMKITSTKKNNQKRKNRNGQH